MSPTISFSPSTLQLMNATPSDCVMVIMNKTEHESLLKMQKEVVDLREKCRVLMEDYAELIVIKEKFKGIITEFR